MSMRLTTTQRKRAEPGSRLSGHVLYVSDDHETADIWAFALQQMGLVVTLATTAADAVRRWEQDTYDLILIDVSGPDLDGIALIRRLRPEAANPILLLSPSRDEALCLQAYAAGVDECIVKPLSPALFLAKVRSWLRRAWTVPSAQLEVLQAGALRLDPARRAVTLANGATARLTNLEFRLLHLLMTHAGQPLPSELIVSRVWGYSGGDSVVLKNLVYRLRGKIEPNPGQPQYIQTAPGGGYVFVP